MENKIIPTQSDEFMRGVRHSLETVIVHLECTGYAEAASEIKKLVTIGERVGILPRQEHAI